MNKVFFVVNNLNFLYSHRAHLIHSFEQKGFDVNLLGLRNDGVNSWFKFIYQLFRYFFIVSKNESHFFLISPLVHVLGIIPQMLSRKSVIVVSTGLGYLGTSAPRFLKLSYFLILRLYASMGSGAIVQNEKDYSFFKLSLGFKKIELVPGTYVHKIAKQNIISEINFRAKLNIICVSRLYRDKGIHNLKELFEKYPVLHDDIHIHLYGPRERMNPAAYSDLEWGEIIACPMLTYHGTIDNQDVHNLLSSGRFSFGILPSYREGMSRFLIECAVYGIPTITTRAPGCIDFEHMGLAKSYEVDNISNMHEVISNSIRMTYDNYLKWSNRCAEFAGDQFSEFNITQGYLRML